MIKRLAWPSAVVIVTTLCGLIPLLGSRDVYLRGDSAAQFAPTWWYFGTTVRDSGLPIGMDPNAFAGGNYPAEALFGIWNPVNMLIWLVVSGFGSLLVSVVLVKVAIMVMIALGAYLVAREYDAAPWAAAAVATALPFSGFTLWWDAGSWPAGLAAFAYAPWVWWAFRRTLRGAMNPWWAFVVGALAITQGNPYGTLAVVIVGGGLVVEGLVTRNLPGVRRLVLTGGCVAALLPLVYLPLVRASELAARADGPMFGNNGKLRPELGDLLGMSSPTFVPSIISITGPTQVPVAYFCWFVLPLLPWLQYRVLRERSRELTGIGVIGLVYLAATLGPSNLWLFRWPLRLIEYSYLALGVALAVVLSKGLARDRWRARSIGTGAIVAALAFQTWAEHPTRVVASVAGIGLLAALSAALVVVHRRSTTSTALVAAVLIGGTALTLGLQARVYEENNGARLYHVPTDVSALQERFGDLDGRVMQFADLRPLQEKAQRTGNDRKLRAAWDNFLPGSMYRVAGVDAVNNYTGMGFVPFEKTLCLHYEGFTRPCGYQRVWEPVTAGGPPLADLLKLQTMVVQPKQAIGVLRGPGWTQREDGKRIVLVRDAPLPWPDSELSWATPGVDVASAQRDGLSETVRLKAAEGGELTFARLAWPGYSATLDGKELEVGRDDAGLLTVAVPRGADGTVEVTYDRPGRAISTLGVGVGVLGALLLGAADVVVRRRRRAAAPQPQTADPLN
ncbi:MULTISPECIES: hypothetical protein [unclassified Nocardioides]|uniref:hypothetical protein n=1 Tax=unclassified Nocardioides TaxID=2615069 RepID=UPI00070274A6|nr:MULTISPECIES: hypothetical protein [unclassified Nocardioides]KRC54829.1 hypothetical protein ASE19_05025 [Nocardioides sp. Root79]KRC73827.1 hypothetical protein ASE20_04195 [Nocardioides sp. Root240]